jgi:hypothetical protein
VAPDRVPPVLALEVTLTSGRPKVPIELRSLIRRTSLENPLWGAPRIHGELLKLGYGIAQSTLLQNLK